MELSAAPSVMRKPGAESAIMGSVTTSSATYSQALRSVKRPDPVAVGTIVWLGSEVMFFAGLFAMYFVSKANSHGDWANQAAQLNVPYAVTITVILVASSFTCQMGVFAAEKGDVFGLRRWSWVSAIMGLIFVAGQGYEYYHLAHEGVTISASVYGSAFFITTGFHGLHVIGGVIAFFHPKKVGKKHYRYFVIAIAGHRCAGASRFFLNDEVAAVDGNQVAIELIADVGTWLGRGMASLAAALDPDLFVIGGGVSAAGDLLLDPARTAFGRALTGRGYRPVAGVERARFGNDAGLIGAADLARHSITDPPGAARGFWPQRRSRHRRRMFSARR